jgi:hypothetical protein
MVAATLGHASIAVTEKHYATADALAEGKQKRALKVLEGGKR